MSVTYWLDDVVERNEAHSTFEIPSAEARKQCKVGMYVKLVFCRADTRPERMWVRITDVALQDNSTARLYTGVLDNEPLSDKMPPRDSVVIFTERHIADIVDGVMCWAARGATGPRGPTGEG